MEIIALAVIAIIYGAIKAHVEDESVRKEQRFWRRNVK